jgi:hypothetical protein
MIKESPCIIINDQRKIFKTIHPTSVIKWFIAYFLRIPKVIIIKYLKHCIFRQFTNVKTHNNMI